MTDDQIPIVEQPLESVTFRPCWACKQRERVWITVPGGESYCSIHCEICSKATPVIEKLYGAAPRVEWGEMTL